MPNKITYDNIYTYTMGSLIDVIEKISENDNK